jgi:peptidoglycan/LPS O-acetylase OafA/YrhL
VSTAHSGSRRQWRSAAAAVAIGICLFTTATWEEGRLGYSIANTLMSVAFGLLLALVVLQTSATRPTRLVRFLELRAIVAAGVVSYSIFLWHEPLIRWLNKHGAFVSSAGGFFANLGLVVIITAAASACTYLLVEAPALRLKFRRGRAERARVPTGQVEAAP